MKKILTIFFLSLFCSGLAFAEPPKYTTSVNENSRKFGWLIEQFRFIASPSVIVIGAQEFSSVIPTEIYTLSKEGWILKCAVTYTHEKAETKYCYIP